MRVLECHNWFRIVGGADIVYFQTIDLLEQAGHQVAPFNVQHPENRPSSFERYFVSPSEFRSLGFRHPLKAAGQALRMVYSLEARRKLSALLAEFPADVAHLHNIYHVMSPSVLSLLRGRGIPTVMTAHDFKLVCPNYKMFLRGRVCEECVDGKLVRAVGRKCVAESYAASAVCTFEGYVHRWFRLWERNLDVIICPSRYLMKRIKCAGYRNELVHIPNSLSAPDSLPERGPGDYVLFFGALLIEKGPQVLVEAARQLPDVPIRIAGRGMLEPSIRETIDRYGLRNIELLGFQPPTSIPGLLAGSRFSVMTSISNENCPMSVLESLAAGRPVIGSAVGGVPELIDDEVSGFLVPPNDPDALADRMRRLWGNPDQALEMGARGYERVKTEFSPEKYLQRLVGVFESAIERKPARG